VALARHDELPSSGALQRFVRDHAVDEIIVAAAEEVGETIWELLECRTNGVAVTDFLAFWERETGRIDLDAISASHLVYSEGFHSRPFRRNSKLALDFAVSAVGLAVTAPVIALAAIAIKLDSPGPVFYRQERVGKNGVPFEIVKLRTMTVDAEKEGTPRWATVGDVRVTRIGALLRRTRIDELPQLINVLKGEMSLVGPRPERPAFVDAFERQIPLYAIRHSVRPGLTGWAQINYRYGASLDDAKRKLEYDLFYVKNHSVVLDIAIMLQTARVVLWLQGGR
jgi:sugar transferase (PEP-CTERM system associated)